MEYRAYTTLTMQTFEFSPISYFVDCTINITANRSVVFEMRLRDRKHVLPTLMSVTQIQKENVAPPE